LAGWVVGLILEDAGDGDLAAFGAEEGDLAGPVAATDGSVMARW